MLQVMALTSVFFVCGQRDRVKRPHATGEDPMLVLSRKSQESVVVGGPGGGERLLVVTVLEIGNGMVRLGFEADRSVAVHRREVWERICDGAETHGPTEKPEARPG